MSRKGANCLATNGSVQNRKTFLAPSSPSTEFTLGHTPPLVDPLTSREEEVLDLLAQEGLTNKEIAKQLGIRTSTVEKHFSSIYGKLGVDGRSEAILWAYRHRTLESTDS